ncbi:MAG: outer membrane lipoprotein-sorting protein, partial [Spirochaetota bacterium]
VRQIASHVKNQNFAGTDFSYEDLSEFQLSQNTTATMVNEENNRWVIKLVPEDKQEHDWKYLQVYYRKDNFYPVRVEYYNFQDEMYKVIERKDLKKIDGYWTARKIVVKDLRKDHSTVSTIEKVKYDVGLDDSVFSKRSLLRMR